MKAIIGALRIIREFRRSYIVLNLVYYGLVICGMAYAASNPSLQQSLLDALRGAFSQGPLAPVAGAYSSGQVLLAIGFTFGVNLAIGSFLWITLPSLVLPFSGLLTGGFRAVLWGLLFSPSSPEMSLVMIPHSLTLILEGQAYILAMLAAYIQGRAFVWPATVDATGHGEGYWAGAKRSLRLYLLVAIVLAVSAVYEVVEVIYIIPLFRGTG
jgi:hypothetical protein